MFHLKLSAFIAFIAVFARGFELDQAQLEKDGMACVAENSDPEFMMGIAQHMDDPDSMARTAFVCNYQKEVVNILMCMKNKIGKSLPEQYRTLLDLVQKDRLADALKFACKYKEDLNGKCMDDHFMQCFQSKVTQLQSLVASGSDPKDLVCRVFRFEEQCLHDNEGTCTKKSVKAAIEFIEKLFPLSECDKTSSGKTDLAKTILGNLLIHGQPQNELKFKPNKYNQYKPYVIKY